MNPDLCITLDNMRRFGGNFCGRLADAIAAADPGNRERLLGAFPELLQRYALGNGQEHQSAAGMPMSL
jgi:hypothetical protein